MKKRVVIALGGNAIQDKGEKGTFEDQLANVNKTMADIVPLILNKDYQVIITHGNGPQVGTIMTQMAAAKEIAPEMPMHMCGAMSQGQIGYLIQQSLANLLKNKNIRRPVVTLVTQVVVDEESPDFKNPSKPVGSYHTEEEARQIMAKTGFVFKEDAGRGWRRVVPSPQPLKVAEIEAIEGLVEKGVIVVASGGGGIPVVEKSQQLTGVDAVIDKDRAAALLGILLKAQVLIILTAVEKVSLNYGKPNEKKLDKLNLKQAKQYMKEGHFAEGSMKPKIEAVISFIEKDPARRVIITHAHTLSQALAGKNGTHICAT